MHLVDLTLDMEINSNSHNNNSNNSNSNKSSNKTLVHSEIKTYSEVLMIPMMMMAVWVGQTWVLLVNNQR